MLIEAGADVNEANYNGERPLHVATEKKDAGCIRLLLEAGANVNGENRQGKTPLSLAVESNSLEILRLLLRTGLNVNVFDKRGRTPLHLAAEKNHVECARLLLRAGARTNIRDKNQRLPHELGQRHASYETEKLIKAFQSRKDVIIRWRHAHAATRDAARVFIAAREGRPLELDKRLRLGKLAGGMKIKGKASLGRAVSPMDAAMMGGHIECVKVLVSHGAKPRLASVIVGMEGQGVLMQQQRAEMDALRARVAELEAKVRQRNGT